MVKLPVVEAAKAAFKFQRRHWRRLWAVGLLLAPFETLLALAEADEAIKPILTIGALPFTLGLSGIGYAALLRLAFSEDHAGDKPLKVGPGGLQLGMVEWRLLGATILKMLLVVLAFAAVCLAGSMIRLAPVFDQGSGAPEQFYWLVGVLAVLAGAYVGLRLMFTAPASVDRGKVQVLATWSLTKGQAMRLVGGVLLTQLIAGFQGLIAMGIGFGLAGGGAAAMDQFSATAGFAEGFFLIGLGVTASVVTVCIYLPVLAGFISYAYRCVRPA